MQSVRAGAVQTHFSIFTPFLKTGSPQTSFWLHFGSNFRPKSEFWVKKGLQKMDQKKGARPYANEGLWPCPEAPWQPPSRARFSEQETTIWARNKNSCSFLNPFQSPFPGMGYFLISCLKKCSCFDEIWNKKDKSLQMFFSYCSFPKACDLTRSGPRPGEFKYVFWSIVGRYG